MKVEFFSRKAPKKVGNERRGYTHAACGNADHILNILKIKESKKCRL
jgi:hypothetical protein